MGIKKRYILISTLLFLFIIMIQPVQGQIDLSFNENNVFEQKENKTIVFHSYRKGSTIGLFTTSTHNAKTIYPYVHIQFIDTQNNNTSWKIERNMNVLDNEGNILQWKELGSGNLVNGFGYWKYTFFETNIRELRITFGNTTFNYKSISVLLFSYAVGEETEKSEIYVSALSVEGQLMSVFGYSLLGAIGSIFAGYNYVRYRKNRRVLIL